MPATALATGRERFADRALGLFLADPFLNIAGQVSRLRRAGVTSVANLPTVEQQDVDFAQQLADVGLDFTREVDHLGRFRRAGFNRSEEHTSELQSLMRISYAVFCLKKKNTVPHQS